MRISAFISGPLGLASITSGLHIVNTTTGVTISNSTKDVNETSAKIGWPKFNPGFPMGHGPVVIPEDKLDDIPVHFPDQWEPTSIQDSSLWLVADLTDEDPANRRDRRVSTQERRSLIKRDGPGDPLPPRDRLLADHMEQHGQMLPECYKKCMRSEDGHSSIHMGKDTLGQICGIKWPMFCWWSEHHLYWCVKDGCPSKEDHRVAYRWLKWTCGDKPV